MEQKKQRGAVRAVLSRALIMAALLAVLLTGLQMAFAAEDQQLVPLGNAVGIKLYSDGVIVIGFAEDYGTVPVKQDGLQAGDIITHVNHIEVDSIDALRSAVQECGDTAISITAMRGQQELLLQTSALCLDDGSYLLGTWVRDSLAGIGTITYYDPATGNFAALGHPINDIDTGIIMPVGEGGILPASVVSVRKGTAGAPGELQGSFQPSIELGTLTQNCSSGIFGTLAADSGFTGQAMSVAARNEVQLGKATIRTTIEGTNVEEFEIEITRVYRSNDEAGRDMTIHVTDPRLLEITGGIVQGMSGSPILQNGKIVGAITHVLVNDPTEGYGILAETMLAAANS